MPEYPSPLTFGIIIEQGPLLEVWQKRCLEKLLESDAARLLLVIHIVPPRERRAGRWTMRHLLWRLYERYRVRNIPMKRKEDGSDLLKHGDIIEDAGDILLQSPAPPESIHRLKSYDLHVVLNLTPYPLKSEVDGVAAYGVWAYCHGHRPHTPPAPPCFESLLRKDPVTTSFLYVGRRDRALILHAGTLKTDWNYRATLNAVLSASTDWVSRACRQLLSMGLDSFPQQESLHGNAMQNAVPTNRHCLHFFWRHLENVVGFILDDLFYYDIWNVGIVRQRVENLDALNHLERIQWLPSLPSLSYVADPFPYTCQSRTYLLVEYYSYRKPGKGQIYRIDLETPSGQFLPEAAITAPEHLSYPFVVTVDGQIYCIPEMYQKNRCQTYRLDHHGAFVFDTWLMEGIRVVDPTVLFHNGYWWMFFTDEKEGSHVKLFAYYADRFHGDWRPHFLNPLKCDVTSARPAGKPFFRQGKLYRPAQDCSRTYGGAVTVNEVVDLSPETFCEIPIATLHPDPDGPYPDGMHHLIVEDNVIFIDSKKRMFNLAFKIKQLLRA